MDRCDLLLCGPAKNRRTPSLGIFFMPQHDNLVHRGSATGRRIPAGPQACLRFDMTTAPTSV
jgi:hypothetical protein